MNPINFGVEFLQFLFAFAYHKFDILLCQIGPFRYRLGSAYFSFFGCSFQTISKCVDVIVCVYMRKFSQNAINAGFSGFPTRKFLLLYEYTAFAPLNFSLIRAF